MFHRPQRPERCRLPSASARGRAPRVTERQQPCRPSAPNCPPQRSARCGLLQPVVRSLRRNHGRHLQPGERREISETERVERSGSEPGRASPIQPLRFRNSYNGEHLDTPDCCDSKQECWNCQAAIRIECSPHPFKKKPYCDPRENNYRSKVFHTLTGSNVMKCISFYSFF